MSPKTNIQKKQMYAFRKHFSYVWSLQCRNIRKTHKTMHALHSRQIMHESLFAGRTSTAYEYYSQMHGK